MCPPAWRGVTRRPTAPFECVRMPGRRQSDREHQQIEGGGAPTNQMAPRQIDPSDPNEKKRVHCGAFGLLPVRRGPHKTKVQYRDRGIERNVGFYESI